MGLWQPFQQPRGCGVRALAGAREICVRALPGIRRNRVRNGMRTPSHESRPPRHRRFRHLPAGRPPFCNVLEFCTPVQAEMSVLRQDRTTPSDETAGRLLASCDENPTTPPRRAQNSRTLHFPSSFVAQGRKTRGHCKTYSDPPLNRSWQGEDCHSERAERRRRIHAVPAVRPACAVQGALSVEHLILHDRRAS